MNRAILIVICDFIVSAMLSMITGGIDAPDQGVRGAVLDQSTASLVINEMRAEQERLEAARKALLDAQFEQGFSASREAELRKISRVLAESQARSEIIAQKLALRPDNTGELTPEKLQKELEKEIANRYQMKLRQDDAARELTYLRNQNQQVAEKYTSLRETVAAKQAELELAKKTVEDREKSLAGTNAELGKSREELAAKLATLEQTRQDLAELDRKSGQLAIKGRESEEALSFTRGRLSATEKELAESQSRFERAQKLANTRDLELTEAKRQLDNLQTVFKKAVSDLSKTKTELTETKTAAEKAEKELAERTKQAEVASAELKSTRERLTDAEDKLRSDVLQRYSASAVKLKLRLREKRMLLDSSTEAEYVLPLVDLGGKVCVIGDFLLLTGNARDRKNFDNFTELAFAALPVEGNGQAQVLPGPLYAPRKECRVGMLEVKPDGRTPLQVLPLSELKKRGIQDLYLFKYSAFGKESASLEGRCSVNFSAGDEYLYIRNSARGTGSELRAEPGDFVLTKQGDFVAVVIAVENLDFGRRQEARCVVFPDNFNWDNVYAMPTAKSPSSEYLEAFSNAATPVLDNIRKLETARPQK